MNRNQQKAFNLLELLMALTVLAILISIIPPSYSHFIERNHTQVVRDELLAHLHFTRAQSVNARSSHTLCGSADGQTCNGNWNNIWLVRRTHDQRILRRFTPESQGQLCWRGFGGNQVVFRANGMSSASNGRFSFCKDKQPLWQVVINRQGRFKIDKPESNVNCC